MANITWPINGLGSNLPPGFLVCRCNAAQRQSATDTPESPADPPPSKGPPAAMLSALGCLVSVLAFAAVAVWLFRQIDEPLWPAGPNLHPLPPARKATPAYHLPPEVIEPSQPDVDRALPSAPLLWLRLVLASAPMSGDNRCCNAFARCANNRSLPSGYPMACSSALDP